MLGGCAKPTKNGGRDRMHRIYYTLVAWAVCKSTIATGGQLIYPLDDTYINMAMAKNFSEHGVWGITRYAFSSSTSSPLYTALLADRILHSGQKRTAALVLNVFFGTILIAYLNRLLRQDGTPSIVFPLLLAISFVTSIPALNLIGMEHLLHALQLSPLFTSAQLRYPRLHQSSLIITLFS